MLVEIDLGLYNHVGSYRHLTQIFFMFLDKRHKLDLGRINKVKKKLDSIEKSEWFEQEAFFAGKSFKTSLFEKLFLKNAYITTSERKQSSKICLNIEGDNKNHYSAKIGVKILSEPLNIFLENADRDRAFVECLARLSNKNLIRKAIDNEWIDFKHGGGTTIASEIARHLKRNNGLFKYIHRFLVIVDSDKNHTDDDYGGTAKGVLTICEEHNPKIDEKSIHIFWKRELENYLPIQIMKLIPNIDLQKINSFAKLSPPQKSFYDLEKGFDNKGKVPEKYNGLFESINDSNKQIYKDLKSGFDIDGVFNVKDTFYKGFASEQLKLQMLQNEMGEEFELILNKIEHSL